jgi:hypothetical protein
VHKAVFAGVSWFACPYTRRFLTGKRYNIEFALIFLRVKGELVFVACRQKWQRETVYPVRVLVTVMAGEGMARLSSWHVEECLA